MAYVKVETETLISGGTYVADKYQENLDKYSSVKSIDTQTCDSLKSFKVALENKNNIYEDHANILSSKIKECANNLEEVDNMIGNNVTSPLASADNLDFSTELGEDAITLDELSNIDIDGTIDFTFDPSNVNISPKELYAKADQIKNANIPTNVKIVKMAKLFHEYTLNWHYSQQNLIYNKDYKATIEDPQKGLCCATGVSAVLYLAGIINRDDILANDGQFNPHFQENIMNAAIKKNWTCINGSDFDKLQPGDIILTNYNANGYSYGHIEIYAGDGYAYSWGSDGQIHKEGPDERTVLGYQRAGSRAYRVTTSQSA